MMNRDAVAALVEGIVVTARGPVRVEAILEAVAEEGLDGEQIVAVLEELQRDWDDESRGVRLERVAGGWRCFTPPQLDPYLRAYHGIAARQRLSQAALEVLAIVAHRQPVTLPEINFIRGANSTGVVRTLLERSLIRVAGRKRVVGKPFLYRTTTEFLVHFGLESPDDLPDPEELVADETVSAE
jgi:segregation and condensation protein B